MKDDSVSLFFILGATAIFATIVYYNRKNSKLVNNSSGKVSMGVRG